MRMRASRSLEPALVEAERGDRRRMKFTPGRFIMRRKTWSNCPRMNCCGAASMSRPRVVECAAAMENAIHARDFLRGLLARLRHPGVGMAARRNSFASKLSVWNFEGSGLHLPALPRRGAIFAATGILFNHGLLAPASSSRKRSCVARGGRKVIRLPVGAGRSGGAGRWGYAPDYVDAMFRIRIPRRAIRCGHRRDAHGCGSRAGCFRRVGLDWRRHVTTDAGLLNKTSHPLRGDSAKLRSATGWAPTIGFLEMVTRLVHDAEELSAGRTSAPLP